MLTQSEVDHERLGWNNVAEGAFLFARHFDAYCCSGEAGTGKTTFAQKLCAYVRSCGKIALGCAATALASQVSVCNISY